MSEWTLVLGGARSGKSQFAQRLMAEKEHKSVTYLASAVAFDDEMKVRIQKHREDRPENWNTVEAPYNALTPLIELSQKPGLILWDCLTVYLNNLLFEQSEKNKNKNISDVENMITAHVNKLIDLKENCKSDLCIVSNEVGGGVVPESELGRLFRDVAGRANQQFAKACEHVYLVTAGIPGKIK